MAAADFNHILQHGTFHEVISLLIAAQGTADFQRIASSVLMAGFERGKIASRPELLTHFPPPSPGEGRFLRH